MRGNNIPPLDFQPVFCQSSWKYSRKGSKLDLQCHTLLPGVAEHAGTKDAASQPEKAIT
jgi:hypothetical protein